MTVDVNDYAVWTWTLTAFAADTAATMAVISPAGVSTAATVTPNADKSVWTSAAVLLTAAGDWTGRLTVTGTGAGVEHQTIQCGPTQPVPAVVYATTTDLANWLHGPPPAGARRMLARATLRVDELCKTAVYDVDANNLPTDPAVIAALRDATCAQVEWMVETGDLAGTAAPEQYQSVSIGSVSLTRAGSGGAGGTAASRYAPNAVTVLQLAGLLPGTVAH